MAKRKSTKRNQNRDDDASSKKVNTGGNGVVGPWSDLNHHVLYLIMMQLGFIDYFSFGGVCKSWRSLAMSNRKTFIASKPPMTMSVFWPSHKIACYLEDSEGRKFKTILPHFSGGACVGLTSGYLIFYKRTTHDFWLVNPITRHELHFPDFPMNYYLSFETQDIKAIPVFSPSMSKWVLVVLPRFCSEILFSEENTGEWDEFSCNTSHFTDLCCFKGKIYTLISNTSSQLVDLCELRLNPESKLILLQTKNFLKHYYDQQLVSSGDNIYMMDCTPENRYRFEELDFVVRKSVLREKGVGESASFLSNFKHGVVDKYRLWGIRGEGLLVGHNMGEMLKVMEVEKTSHFTANMWYFPHVCLNVDRLDE